MFVGLWFYAFPPVKKKNPDPHRCEPTFVFSQKAFLDVDRDKRVHTNRTI